MSEFTVNDFCRALVSTLVEKYEKHDIHFDDERTAKALGSVIEAVWNEAKRSWDAGDCDRAAVLANWLDSIAPNPNTGAFDGFWQAFRNLQPLDLGVKNPRYIRLDATLDHSYRKATLETIPTEWLGLVEESGDLLKQAA